MRRTIILLLLIFVVVVMSGCGDPPECEQHDDCVATTPCADAVCMEGVCEQLPKDDCCGNGRCEAAAGETVCSCEDDCKITSTPTGLCEGKLQVEHPRRASELIDATYATYYCEEDDCVVGALPTDVEEQQLFSTHNEEVSFDLVTTISNPFVIGKGSCTVRIKLTDISERARGPIKITGIQVLSDKELIAEKSLSRFLTTVGTTVEETLQLDPSLKKIEELRSIWVKVNYEYTYIARDDTFLKRNSMGESYNNIYFIDPDKVVIE